MKSTIKPNSLDSLKLNCAETRAIEEFRQLVGKALGSNLLSIRLFGSKARGEDKSDSDVDIFVLVNKRTPEVADGVIDIAFEVNLTYGVFISPRVVEKSILENPVWKITPFLKNVEKEGILL